MDDALIRLDEELQARRPAVLLTVVAASGSAPRKAGSRCVVPFFGDPAGTIGGGAAEYEAVKTAREVLHSRLSQLLTFDLGGRADDGGVCGGMMTVLCQYVPCGAAPCVHYLASEIRMGRAVRIVCDLTDLPQWAMAVSGDETVMCRCGGSADRLQEWLRHDEDFPPGSLPFFADERGRRMYAETIQAPQRVIVFGGGHVACALVPLLTRLGFSCTVVDDRAEFVESRRFPDAAERITADFSALPPELAVGRNDYVCIMTRGHSGDYAVEKQILPRWPAYIGVIGSRKKEAFVRRKLRDDGFSDALLDEVHTPIGLPISAATPEEIAVSIAAELIAVRARREGREKQDAYEWRTAHEPHHRVPRREPDGGRDAVERLDGSVSPDR